MTSTSKQVYWMNGITKVVLSFASFLIGGFIYLCYRPTTLRMFEWSRILGLDNSIKNLRRHASNFSFGDFFIYCLPDGLWVTSYILIVDYIWTGNRKYQKLLCGILPVIGVVTESLQAVGILSGTFDVFDILCYAIPYFIYLTFKSLQK